MIKGQKKLKKKRKREKHCKLIFFKFGQQHVYLSDQLSSLNPLKHPVCVVPENIHSSQRLINKLPVIYLLLYYTIYCNMLQLEKLKSTFCLV